jgi:hypothetical protein
MASTLALQSPADVVNASLAQIGSKLRVGNLYDGSLPAKKALDIYGQTRDELLRQGEWDFAKVISQATLSGNAAPPPWLYEFSYPASGLRIRDIFSAGYLTSRNNPLPVLWTVGSAIGKVIWANVSPAIVVYTNQVTNPILWEADFAEALIAALGKRLSASLASPDMAKMATEDEKAAIGVAESVVG